ncbi:hypothetical protein MMC09_002254 [Bachmanniomyces sp. S44760]|nr:hypothetical protein [Bachmanniomyces sp. S44760]
MGKAGRFACIFVPMALTLASALLLIVVGLGGTNKNTTTLSNLYFMRANTSEISANATTLLNKLPNDTSHIPGAENLSSDLPSLPSLEANGTKLQEFYSLYLWNYCAGNGSMNGNDTIATAANTTDHVNYCSPRANHFWFDLKTVFGLNDMGADVLFGADLNKALGTYQTASGWLSTLFYLSICATFAEIICGFGAIFSRIGSVVTTIVSAISSVFILGFATLATGIYITLMGAFNTALKPYNVSASLGGSMFTVLWVAVVLSWISGFFWMISSCCCSGRSSHPRNQGFQKTTSVERTPYTYEQVGGHPMNNINITAAPMGHQPTGTAYEPFRQSRV